MRPLDDLDPRPVPPVAGQLTLDLDDPTVETAPDRPTDDHPTPLELDDDERATR